MKTCGHCGTVNLHPDTRLTKRPLCSQCGKPLPEHGSVRPAYSEPIPSINIEGVSLPGGNYRTKPRAVE
jgi:hypothetical protein